VLQYFDATKRIESAYKQLRYGGLEALEALVGVGSSSPGNSSSGEGGALPSGAGGPPSADVSAVDPNRYAVRFMDFAASRLFVTPGVQS
jgi:hypothetical protein